MARKYLFEEKDIIKLENNRFKLLGKEIKHIHVLRYKIGDEILINEYFCKISEIKEDYLIVNILNKVEVSLSDLNISVFQSYLKGSKMELVTQKLTEIGVNNIIPFLSTNCVVKLDDKNKVKKVDKLKIVTKEAIKQSGRLDDIVISKVLEFKEMINILNNYDLVIFAYEKENISLKERFNSLDKSKYKNIALIVGPEGGFTLKESELISNLKNSITVSLGKNILRAETASIFLTSIVKYEFDI